VIGGAVFCFFNLCRGCCVVVCVPLVEYFGGIVLYIFAENMFVFSKKVLL
jgi:hypothetical protein